MSRKTRIPGLGFFNRNKAHNVSNRIEAEPDEMTISPPTSVVRNVHIHLNPITGKLEGVPEAWKKYVGSAIR